MSAFYKLTNNDLDNYNNENNTYRKQIYTYIDATNDIVEINLESIAFNKNNNIEQFIIICNNLPKNIFMGYKLLQSVLVDRNRLENERIFLNFRHGTEISKEVHTEIVIEILDIHKNPLDISSLFPEFNIHFYKK